MTTLMILLLMGLFQPVSKTEIQKYQTIKTDKDFEIRFYPPAILASVDMAGSYDDSRNSSFGTLAGYIFGGNRESMQISMTAPVRMSETDGTMSFVMPSGFTMETLPEPKSNRVKLHMSEPQYVAVVRFSGWANERKISEMKEKLSGWLGKEGLRHSSHFEYLGYNPPYQLTNRRNEVLVPLVGFSQDAVSAKNR
jgi:hypothetical protein